MSQSIKDIFYHSLLARASYANLELEDDPLEQANQWSKITKGQFQTTSNPNSTLSPRR